MRVTKRERILLRILGYRCCVTCEHFNSKTNSCDYEPCVLEGLFDLRKNKWLRQRKKTRIDRLTCIGSACDFWKGFKICKEEKKEKVY